MKTITIKEKANLLLDEVYYRWELYKFMAYIVRKKLSQRVKLLKW